MAVLREYHVFCDFGLHRRGRVFGIPVADIAEDLPEGAAHLIVPIGVDNGVDEGIDLCQQEDILLQSQHIAALTSQPVQQEQHLSWSPADHEGTENDDDGFGEIDHGLLVAGVEAGVFGHVRYLPLDIDEDVRVDHHHDEEDDQVGDGPEDQVAPAVEGCHAGALAQITQAVPAVGWDEAKQQGGDPNAADQNHHPLVGHCAVQLHGEDCLVPLHSDGQQVHHGGGQAGVQQALPDEPGAEGEPCCPGPRVEHEEHVGDASEEIRGRQVPQQVVDGVVEAPVDDDGGDDQQVGQEHDDADCQAQSNNQDILGPPVGGQLLLAVVVEKPHTLIVEAAGHRHSLLSERGLLQRWKGCSCRHWLSRPTAVF